MVALRELAHTGGLDFVARVGDRPEVSNQLGRASRLLVELFHHPGFKVRHQHQICSFTQEHRILHCLFRFSGCALKKMFWLKFGSKADLQSRMSSEPRLAERTSCSLGCLER
jgi:hypothetical protein